MAGNITEAQQFNDPDPGGFFMRVAYDIDGDKVPVLAAELDAVARPFAMTWKLRPEQQKKVVLILVSKLDHC